MRPSDCDHDTHAALKACPDKWHGLPIVGVQFGDLEMRNCKSCGSTLALPVGFHAVWSAFGRGVGREVRR